ncbi:hypothetical protein AVEN_97756-1 [Araneus ventricosus]|uniref:Uncharacterized protein n=1 Tax=Araneus ventricosus TaxID=182803 RepID=A0A4Y2E2J5_ARAVE|nr:hypothetical protein AVEN_97756-1 [Araneus ventricosus]
MHSEIPAGYDTSAMSCPSEVEWCKKFEEGHKILADEEELRRSSTSSTTDLKQLVNDTILKNHRFIVQRKHTDDELTEYQGGHQFSHDDRVETSFIFLLHDHEANF